MERQTFTAHPYYPLHIDIPHHVPNETPIAVLLGAFAALLGTVIVSALFLASRTRRSAGGGSKPLSGSELGALGWFVLCEFCCPGGSGMGWGSKLSVFSAGAVVDSLVAMADWRAGRGSKGGTLHCFFEGIAQTCHPCAWQVLAGADSRF
jgi:hypothetical protein